MARDGDAPTESATCTDGSAYTLDQRVRETIGDRKATIHDAGGNHQGADMRIEPEISGVSVVLLGQFNPAIFTPAWFALHDLLPVGAAENAVLQVAHQHLTAFSTDWLSFRVTLDTCTFETVQAPHIRVPDLVVRTFREHLNHTPLTALGINRDGTFRGTKRRRTGSDRPKARADRPVGSLGTGTRIGR